VIDPISLLMGPLANPECARASRRGWLIWVRLLPAVASSAVAFVVLWVFWIGRQIDPDHQPFVEIHTGLSIVEGILAAFAMILAPAVLAGSLAGEKERGSIGLLLTTRVNAAEVVLGKLAGQLSLVLMIGLAALPALLLLAALSGMGPLSTASLVVLPMGLALGGGGLALAASAMSRRGRDALLLVYLVEILALVVPLVVALPGWVGLVNPYPGLMALTWADEAVPSLLTAGGWAIFGLAGLAVAAWRLRPSCLAEGSDARARRRDRRWGRVPPLDNRPMLWKELYIERAGTLGRVGRWIGALLILWLAAGSLALGGLAGWGSWHGTDVDRANWAIGKLSEWYGGSVIFVSLLIQWAIGLRGAVAISSERERGTWDALLTSPLEGSEIIRSKLWGSLHALRWLIGSAVLAWTVSALSGAMMVREYVESLAGLLILGTFLSAAGVRTSLRAATATRAMGVTIGIWLGTYILALGVAVIACAAVAVACILGWLAATQAGLVPSSARPWFPMPFWLGIDLVFHGQFLALTFLVVIETRLRFDRVAGRMTAGAAAVAVERLIHGRPMAPVLLDGAARPKPVAEPELDRAIG